jgi:hypothetical protein
MKWTIALAALLFAASPAVPQESPYSTARPPERFQSDNATVAVFVADVTTICGPLPDGYRIIACVRKSKSGATIMVMPNPCLFRTEVYAHIACHELGHVNGWRHEE